MMQPGHDWMRDFDCFVRYEDYGINHDLARASLGVVGVGVNL